jgi:hypothetical protein
MKNVKSNISFFIDEKIRSNSTIIFNTVGSKVFEQVNLKNRNIGLSTSTRIITWKVIKNKK